MAQANAAIRLPNLKVAVSAARSAMKTNECTSCLLGKQAKKHIPSRSKPRSQKPGSRLHSHICRPLRTPTLSGGNYAVVFKDEATNYYLAHIVRSRESTFDCLRKAIAFFESKGYSVRTLVTDNGSEYTSKRTQELLVSKSILHELSAPFTPAQTGFVERDNRTIIEAARTMLYHNNLPVYLWGEAVSTAVYSLNRITNKFTNDKKPHELLLGAKPRVDLVVFGCLAYFKMQHKNEADTSPKYTKRAMPQS